MDGLDTSKDVCPRRKVAVFGAGVAGLSVAHELVRRQWDVTVYETNSEVGGFFRSARTGDNMPSEYSWHGMGPWYRNVFDIMKQIPSRTGSGTVYDASLSRPVSFGIVSDDGSALFNVRNRFHLTARDFILGAYMMMKTWTANRRSQDHYSGVLASESYRPLLSDKAWRTWRSCFGPWVGSDWHHVSLHQVGLFFRKQFYPGQAHHHLADDEGGAWDHGARIGWLLLKGPSSEEWFDPWVQDLERRGVRLRCSTSLERLSFCSEQGLVTEAHLENGETVEADAYVLATDPFTAARVVGKTLGGLADIEQLKLLEPLVAGGPHTQVSFRIAFGQRIAWPHERTGVVIADSEFNLTIFAQEQAWREDEDLGDGVVSLWSGTACVSKTPGRLYGLPLEECSEEQFVDEVMAQLSSCRGLDGLIREANDGRTWRDFPIVRIEVWNEWMFSQDGIQAQQPKWVNTTKTQPFLPRQRTPVPNLILAGAHTRTEADVWSIEAAVESGRRAAQVLEPEVTVVPEHVPVVLRLLRTLDDVCYVLRLPHVLDLTLLGVMVLLIFMGVR